MNRQAQLNPTGRACAGGATTLGTTPLGVKRPHGGLTPRRSPPFHNASGKGT
jgi:hypothetical protein